LPKKIIIIIIKKLKKGRIGENRMNRKKGNKIYIPLFFPFLDLREVVVLLINGIRCNISLESVAFLLFIMKT